MDWLNWNTAWWRGLEPSGDRKMEVCIVGYGCYFGHYINYTGIPDQSANADPYTQKHTRSGMTTANLIKLMEESDI